MHVKCIGAAIVIGLALVDRKKFKALASKDTLRIAKAIDIEPRLQVSRGGQPLALGQPTAI
jgi:hypothetical protein